ncbi:MAG: TadE/TadG family type IV pilus assembly protein [Vicinamibacterales bacterium]
MMTRETAHRRRSWRSERGVELIETAFTIPMLLLIAVGIFEFGRAYQSWQILTNAAREAARVAVLPATGPAAAADAARNYMQNGQLQNYGAASIDVDQFATIMVDGDDISASTVTVQYPFDFIVLGPVARLINPSTTLGGDLTMVATAVMRNEAAN